MSPRPEPPSGIRRRLAWSGPFDAEEAEACASDERMHWRPKTRADCAGIPRPCPFVSCRHHLALDVLAATAGGKVGGSSEHQSVIVEPEMRGDPATVLERMPETCSLDVAERGEHTLEQLGEILGVTKQRMSQIETEVFAKWRAVTSRTHAG